MLLDIVPLKGVGPIRLGMSSEEAQTAMKNFCGEEYRHFQSRGIDYFFGGALEVSYDDDGYAEFIGSQYYTGCGCDFRIYGIDPFDTSAKVLFESIASKQSGQHDFDPDDYLFRDNIITLWHSEEQYDYKGGETRPVYAQIGIGNTRYLSAIDKIKIA